MSVTFQYINGSGGTHAGIKSQRSGKRDISGGVFTAENTRTAATFGLTSLTAGFVFLTIIAIILFGIRISVVIVVSIRIAVIVFDIVVTLIIIVIVFCIIVALVVIAVIFLRAPFCLPPLFLLFVIIVFRGFTAPAKKMRK